MHHKFISEITVDKEGLQGDSKGAVLRDELERMWKLS
jgi:hypothetical protein